MAKAFRDELVFVPLGGVGEIGMNMAAYGFGPERNRKWIVVDCGVTFGGPNEPGIELILPDPAFLEEHADDVLALILTHSHEDHYGAVLDLWPAFDKPVYATAFTAAMLAAKRATDDIVDNVEVKPMRVGKPFTLGPFTIEAINVAHSIPESCALLITTPIGRVVHTGDWKLDPNPVGGPPTDIARFTRNRRRQVEPDRADLRLDQCAEGRHQPQRGRGRGHSRGADRRRPASRRHHHLRLQCRPRDLDRPRGPEGRPPGRHVGPGAAPDFRHRPRTGHARRHRPFLDQDEYKTLPRTKIVLLCTGSQGEARAAIARIAREEHPEIDLNAGDRVIFSSWAIPGNEREVIDIQNLLIDRGIEVITQRDGLVHTTGHPRREELKRLYDLVEAAILVPVHGEAAHLEAHAALGRQHGIPTVVHARNGDMVRLFPEPTHFPGEVRTGELYLDGNILCTPDESGVKGRRRLSFGGHIVVSLCVNARGRSFRVPRLRDRGPARGRGRRGLVGDIVRRTVNGTLKSHSAQAPLPIPTWSTPRSSARCAAKSSS